MENKVSLLDSTLRDGAQGFGVNYSTADKLGIVQLLDHLGIDYIEVGNPASNPREREIFEKLKGVRLKHSTLVAFGSTRRKDVPVEDDAGLKMLLDAGTEVCTLFGKCSMFHTLSVLETTPQENLKMIEESCRYLVDHGKRVFFDAEHFFDGFKENHDYAMKCVRAAVSGGAELVCLCDTNGGVFPSMAANLVKRVVKAVNAEIGVHFHNDGGLAVASSIACSRMGATHIQGTFLGIGERCGNANLSSVIPNLQLKFGIECIPQENIKLLTHCAKELAAVGNADLPATMPFVGEAAFSHKAGMHAAAVIKNPHSFEHIDPYIVGNSRSFPTSEISGRSVIFERIHEMFPDLAGEGTEKVLKEIKRLESLGYQLEGADASFELLVRKQLGLFTPYFTLINYRIYTGVGIDEEYSASATVKIKVGDELQLMAAEGNGPVNALDTALRKALERFFPILSEVKLTDYKVRVLEGSQATAASVRVLITSVCGKERFTTVGVSQDVVDASRKAIEDSIEYILYKNRG